MQVIRSTVATSLLMSVLAPPPVIADPDIEVAPFVGYRGGGGFEDRDTAGDLDVDESASFGVAVSRSLDRRRRLELWYSRQSSEVTGDNGTFTGNPLFDVDVHYLHLGGTVEVDDSTAFRSFVSGGLGVTHFDPDRSGLDAETRLSLSLGVGGKTYFSRNAGLRLEARFIGTLMDNDSSLFCVDGSCALQVDGGLFGQWEFGAGVFVAF